MTNITCDHCESEVDIANDKNCVIYDPSGITAVMCEACRERAYDRWQEGLMAGDGPPSLIEQQRQAYRIKRGWRV